MKKKLLLLGWDAADWEVIDDLLAKGLMPALKRVLDNGIRGKIATMDPPISPMLWTSIATGVEPAQHGILGFIEATPDGTDLRALNSTSRKVKAFWNILNQNNLKCNIISWWPSHPAEPINGVMVSNYYQMITKLNPKNWSIQKGTVYPDSLSETLSEFRVHPTELGPTHLLPFIPNFLAIDHENEKRPAQLRKEIAHAASVQAAATYLVENTEWDVTAAYFDFIDHCSHLAMRYREPQQKYISDEDFNNYKEVVNSAYRFQDMMLERMLDLIDENTSVMIVSDHGFESGLMRPVQVPKEPSGPTHEHSPYGIFVWSGPGIKKNQKVYGATLLDITPTILSYFDIPIGKDMKGNVIISAYENLPKISFVDSWEKITEGYSGQHDLKNLIDDQDSKEAMNQLIELGYIEKPSDDKMLAIEKCNTENKYFLARSLMHGHHYNEALPILEELVEKNGDVFRYISLLTHCYLQQNEFIKCKELIDKLLDFNENWVKAFAHYMKGKLAAAQFKGKRALNEYKKSLELAPNSTEVNFQIASVLLGMTHYSEAIEYYNIVLKRDQRHLLSLYGKANSLFKMNKLEDSIDVLLEVIEMQFMFLPAHYLLGCALYNNKEIDLAEQAFVTCLSLSPKMVKPKIKLLDIYKNDKKDPDKYTIILAKLNENERIGANYIVGLPGSGFEELFELLKPNFEKYDDLRSQDDTQGNRIIKSIETNYSNNNLYLIDFPMLFNIKQGSMLNLILVESNISNVLQKQLKISGKTSFIKNKVFPTGLNQANVKQLELFESWILERPEINVLRVNADDDEKNIDDIISQINYFINVKS